MLKMSYAGCLGPSPVISEQFTLKMCVASGKFAKNHILGVQGHSTSSMLTPVKKVVTIACYEHVCT